MRRPRAPRILLGDFNEWAPYGKTLRQLHARLGRSRGVRSFPSILPLFALDRIWAWPKDALVSVRAHRSGLAPARVRSPSRDRRGRAVPLTAGTKRWVGIAVTAAFFAVVVALLHRELRAVEPDEVLGVLREIAASRIALALLLTAAATRWSRATTGSVRAMPASGCPRRSACRSRS
jgi:hypothetical protein